MTVRAELEISLARVDDGTSPTATVTKAGDIATITITDVNGTTQESLTDSASVLGGIEDSIAQMEESMASMVNMQQLSSMLTQALLEPTQSIADISDRLTPLETDLSQLFEITNDGTILRGLKRSGDDIVEGEYYMKLTAQGIYLYKTGESDPIAYFQATGLDTPFAVTNKLQIGDWELIQRDEGNLSLIHVG